MASDIKTAWARQFKQLPGLRHELKKTFDSEAVYFDAACIGMVRESAISNFGHQHAALQSGAGEQYAG